MPVMRKVSQMKSKIVLNFTHEETRTFGDYEPVFNLRITNSYWPPIIDLTYINDTCEVSGPLLALLIEICKKYAYSITYIKPRNDTLETYYALVTNGTIDVFLYPTIPGALEEMPEILATSMGFLNMISLLSGVGWKKSRIFSFLHCFQPFVWGLLALTFVLCSTLASYLKSNKTQILFFYSILLNQSNKMVLKQLDRIYAFLLFIWVISCLFIYNSFHEALLSSLYHEKAHVVIDSLENMAEFAVEGKLKEFYALKGESCESYVNERPDLFGASLKPIMKVIEVEEAEKNKWEEQIFPLLSTGEYVLVSDNSYLDYYFTTKLSKFPNIYRGSEELMALPYFVPLTKNIPAHIRNNINKIIIQLMESGIYDYWIKDSLYMNNEALRLGLIDMNGQRATPPNRKQLHLRHFYGDVLILVFGSFLSIVVFLNEKYFRRRKRILFKKVNKHANLPRKSASQLYFDRKRRKHFNIFELKKKQAKKDETKKKN